MNTNYTLLPLGTISHTNNMTEEEQPQESDSLEKPLLITSTKNNLGGLNPLRLKCLFFVTGCLAAALAQYMLVRTLWTDEVLSESASGVVMFSLLWSFWTCAIVFSSLILLLRFLVRPVTSNENIIFSLEAHHITGSLLSVSGSWFAADFLEISMPTHGHALSLVGLGIIIYALFYRFTTFRTRRQKSISLDDNPTDSMLPTYQLLAGTIGLLIGICSQFALQFCVWSEGKTHPFMERPLAFAFLWSIVTVIICFIGNRFVCLLADVDTCSPLDRERIFLRMETHYVCSVVFGIFSAWIIINITLGIKAEVLKTVAMLAFCAIAFRCIVIFFPEEDCLAEIELRDADDDEIKKPLEVVLV